MTKVVHNKKSSYTVYIGRGGPWGNPIALGKVCFVCGETHRAKGSTLSCYRRWLASRLQDPEFEKSLLTLDGEVLGCWCKPGPCHGDVICDAITYLRSTGSTDGLDSS